MRQLSVLFIALSLVLSACGTPEAAVATPSPEESVGSAPQATSQPTLSISSSSEEIRTALLQTASVWKSIWLDGTVTWYPTDGSDAPPQVYHEQAWIEPALARFRTLLGPGDGAAEQFTASDGKTVLKIDLKTGSSSIQSLADLCKRSSCRFDASSALGADRDSD